MDFDLHERYRELCRRNGWRCTHQRFAVYAFLQGNRTHPGVDEVWAAVRKETPSITRESVFRILCEFAEKGIVMRMDALPSARFDADTRPHGHFICERCGKVFDFELPQGIDLRSPLKGAKVSGVELRFTGLCPRHAKKRDFVESESAKAKKKGKTK